MRTGEWLQSLKLGEPQVAADFFAVFPLTVAESNGRDYLTLEEARQRGLVSIAETGSVSEIVVTVKGEKPVLVPEGVILVGGWQNRTVNITLLLEPNKKHHIPVSCVERGRWEPRGSRYGIPHLFPEPVREGEFSVAAFHAHSILRQLKVESLTMAMQFRSSPRAVQDAVWGEVRRKLDAMGTESETKDETEFYARHETSIGDLLSPIAPAENQVGALIAIGERVVGLEAFDHPETWRVLYRHILAGYAADALEGLRRGQPRGVVTASEAAEFQVQVANALSQATVKPAPVGLGEHHLLDGERGGVSGFALVHDGKVRHLFAFPTFDRRYRRWEG